jgi:hypothetical protein
MPFAALLLRGLLLFVVRNVRNAFGCFFSIPIAFPAAYQQSFDAVLSTPTYTLLSH